MNRTIEVTMQLAVSAFLAVVATVVLATSVNVGTAEGSRLSQWTAAQPAVVAPTMQA